MKKYTKSLPFSYSIGVYPTLELLLTHPAQVDRVLISSSGNKNRGLQEIIKICQQQKIKLETADGLITRIAASQNCYAVGVFNKYETELSQGNHLVLVSPGDQGNLGTIVRTMVAFDITNLAIIKPAVDIFDPHVIRASMGAVFRINFDYYDSFSYYQSQFTNHLYPFLTNGQQSLSQVKFDQPYSLIFGNEASGLPDEYLHLDQSVSIPHSSNVDSLNLSVAVGIALYAAKTQT